MKISETHLSGHRYDIRLPLFGEAMPDLFYSRMAEEIIGYASSSAEVRRYTAAYSAEERGGIVFVEIELRVRIVRPGGISVLRKLLCQTWKGEFLTSFSTETF